MNKKDTADLAELVSNLNKAIADIDNGRFEIYATPQKRGPYATFVMEDKAWNETEAFEVRWYTFQRSDGIISYNPEILDRVNRFIVERRGR